MRRRAVVGALLAALLAPASAAASSPRWELTAAGDPLLVRQVAAKSAYQPAWLSCAPAVSCRFAGTGDRLEPGETPRGTFFESDAGTSSREPFRSPVWGGRVAAALPPALKGSATPGMSVRPVPAVWTGGWGDEMSSVAVLACPSPSRTDCEQLTGPVLPKHRGWSLYAVEARGTRTTPPAPVGAARPAPSALVAVSAPAGPVADAPPEATVVLRARVARSARRVTVGRVTCERRCRVELSVARVRRTFTAKGTVRLAISAARVPRTTRPLVTVTVDGLRLATEKLRA